MSCIILDLFFLSGDFFHLQIFLIRKLSESHLKVIHYYFCGNFCYMLNTWELKIKIIFCDIINNFVKNIIFLTVFEKKCSRQLRNSNKCVLG